MLYLYILIAIHAILIAYLFIRYDRIQSQLNTVFLNQRNLAEIVETQLKIYQLEKKTDKIGGTD